MRSIFLLLTILLIALFAINCGGGGGGQQTDILRQDSLTIGPGEGDSETFGEITLDIPSGAFPSGATLTLTQYSQAPFQAGNPNFQPAKPSFELRCDSPAAEPINVKVTGSPDSYIVGQRDETGWVALETVPVGDQLVFSLTGQASLQPAQGGGNLWQVIIGIVRDNLPDSGFGLELVAGSGEFGDGSTIIIHGLFDNALSVKDLAVRLRNRFGWRNVYSLAYPWWQATPEVAQYLGSILDTPGLSPKTLTIVGHSRGGIIARYALEALDKSIPVKDAIFICTPHKGSPFANGADVRLSFLTGWLNDPFPASPLGLLLNATCIEELKLNSPFLTELNDYDWEQRGTVNYYLMAGANDRVVSVGSALAEGVDLQELTGGNVLRHEIGQMSHGSIKHSASQVGTLADLIGTPASGLRITANPNPVEAQTDGWHFSVNIENVSTETLTVDNLSLSQHRRDGLWYLGQWYNPGTSGGNLHPDRYFYWGRQLQPNETVTIQLHWRTTEDLDPIWTLEPLWQARTAVIVAQVAQGSGQPWQMDSVNVVAYYQDIWPQQPQTLRPATLLPQPAMGAFAGGG